MLVRRSTPHELSASYESAIQAAPTCRHVYASAGKRLGNCLEHPAKSAVKDVVKTSLAAGAAFVAALSGGCAQVSGTGWEGLWRDRHGGEVARGVVSTVVGPEHCGWESTVLLHLGWPLGHAGPSSSDTRIYIRDPEGVFAGELPVPFDDDAKLPRDAKYTGYHLGDTELWISRATAAKAVYLVHGEAVERWPRHGDFGACA